jgi:hypothetical protein
MTTIEGDPNRVTPIRVQVVRFDIPFLQLVWLLIKVAIAAIPAAIVFAMVMGVITTVIGLMFSGLFGSFLNGIFSGGRWI